VQLDRSSGNDIDRCIDAIMGELHQQHELAMQLDDGPLRQATLSLLESSLYVYRFISTKRRKSPT